MEFQETQNRLRLVVLSLEGVPEADRLSRLRQELKAIVGQTPRKDQARLLEYLGEVFPVWPPDVPPIPPPSEEEMADKLRFRLEASDGDRRRIEELLRARELGCGLREADVRRIREKVAIEPGAQPEIGRIVDFLLAAVQALTDIDASLRKFLQDHGAGMMGVGMPRFRDAVVKLLTVPDTDPTRHARLAELENVCTFLTRAATISAQWSQPFAKEVSDKLAPRVIESVVPDRKFRGADHEGYWDEFVARLGGRKDEANMKAWLQDTMKRTIGDV